MQYELSNIMNSAVFQYRPNVKSSTLVICVMEHTLNPNVAGACLHFLKWQFLPEKNWSGGFKFFDFSKFIINLKKNKKNLVFPRVSLWYLEGAGTQTYVQEDLLI